MWGWERKIEPPHSLDRLLLVRCFPIISGFSTILCRFATRISEFFFLLAFSVVFFFLVDSSSTSSVTTTLEPSLPPKRHLHLHSLTKFVTSHRSQLLRRPSPPYVWLCPVFHGFLFIISSLHCSSSPLGQHLSTSNICQGFINLKGISGWVKVHRIGKRLRIKVFGGWWRTCSQAFAWIWRRQWWRDSQNSVRSNWGFWC